MLAAAARDGTTAIMPIAILNSTVATIATAAASAELANGTKAEGGTAATTTTTNSGIAISIGRKDGCDVAAKIGETTVIHTSNNKTANAGHVFNEAARGDVANEDDVTAEIHSPTVHTRKTAKGETSTPHANSNAVSVAFDVIREKNTTTKTTIAKAATTAIVSSGIKGADTATEAAAVIKIAEEIRKRWKVYGLAIATARDTCQKAAIGER